MTNSEDSIYFDGSTYEPEHDKERLSGQLARVYEAMRDGEWRGLYTTSQITGDPLQSISARLRDLRKPRFGAMNIERRRVLAGLFEYRLKPKDQF